MDGAGSDSGAHPAGHARGRGERKYRRDQRGGLNQPSRRDALSDLARRGIMAYAERAIWSDHNLASQAAKDNAHLTRAAEVLARAGAAPQPRDG